MESTKCQLYITYDIMSNISYQSAETSPRLRTVGGGGFETSLCCNGMGSLARVTPPSDPPLLLCGGKLSCCFIFFTIPRESGMLL